MFSYSGMVHSTLVRGMGSARVHDHCKFKTNRSTINGYVRELDVKKGAELKMLRNRSIYRHIGNENCRRPKRPRAKY